MLLELRGVSAGYNGITVVHDVSLEVGNGEVVTLLGANGAGKTTTLRAISQLLPGYDGTMTFDGRSIAGLRGDQLVALGLSHVPEGRRVFPGLSVLDNLKMGAVPRKLGRRQLVHETKRVFELFPRLQDLAGRAAWTLSGGEAQMLAVGRGLMAAPKLLLLDEPSLGLAPLMIQHVLRTVEAVAQAGVSVLLVEQNANLALKIASRAYVIEAGRIVMAGEAAALAKDDRVKAAYLGGHVSLPAS